MRNLILLILSICSIYSCENEDIIRPEWDYQYIFIKNGDPDLFRIYLESRTEYPDEDTHSGDAVTKQSNINNSRDVLRLYDKIVFTPDFKVYPGCIVTFYLKSSKLEDIDNDGFDEEVYSYYSLHDTLTDSLQTNFTVRWPQDSIFFEER